MASTPVWTAGNNVLIAVSSVIMRRDLNGVKGNGKNGLQKGCEKH